MSGGNKKYLHLVCLHLMAAALFCQPVARAQDHYRMSLLSSWNNTSLPRLNGFQIWNDLTGYYDSTTHREYVIAGSTDSIYFFDVTDPYHMKLCDVENSRAHNVVNRDYECYLHYVYCVNDNGPVGSLQVFDLKHLPDSVHKVFDSDSFTVKTHTIFIETASKRLYLSSNALKGGGFAALDIMSLENPEHPVFLARLQVPISADGAPFIKAMHETYVRHDTAYCSAGYEGLWIFDLRDLAHQRLIGNIINYPQAGYCHSSWPDASGKHLAVTDEVPTGLAVKIFDISDIANARLECLFRSHSGATAHNVYWKDSLLYISYYHDGVYVYDVRDTEHPEPVAWYDTYPQNAPDEYHGYNGCWGVYVFLPSGNIAASDMYNGIFMLRADSNLLDVAEPADARAMRLYPNPASDRLSIALNGMRGWCSFRMYDISGRTVLEKNLLLSASQNTFEEPLQHLLPGVYIAEARCGQFTVRSKVIKQ
jgi:choice-of-anchor B domain-containing protein